MPKFNVYVVKRSEFYVEAESRQELENAFRKDWRFLNDLNYDNLEVDHIQEMKPNFKVNKYELVTIDENGEFSI